MKQFYGFLYKIALVWSIAAMIYFVANDRGWLDPKPVQNNTAQAMDISDDQWQAFKPYAKIGSVSLLLFALMGVIMRFLIVPSINRIGDFTIGENGQPIPKKVVFSNSFDRFNPRKENKVGVMNPNRLADGVTAFRWNGQFETHNSSGNHYAPEQQLAIAKQAAQAEASGWAATNGKAAKSNQTDALERAGFFQERTMSARAKRLLDEQKLIDYENKHVPTIDVEPAAFDWGTATIKQALQNMTPTALVVGQNQTTGDIETWDLKSDNAHIRFHGETQSGKTSMQLFIACQMIIMGWCVVICDRRKFKDWGVLDGYAQLIDTEDPRILDYVLKEIVNLHKGRDIRVGEYQCGNVDNLPDGKKVPRVALVIDEWGTQATWAKRAGIIDSINANLLTLAAESASNGIHLCIADQKPIAETWDSIVRGNIGAMLCGHIARGGGISAMGTDQAWQLDKHCFYFNKLDDVVKAWASDDVIPYLSKVPKSQRRYVNLDKVQRISKKVVASQADESPQGKKSSPKRDECLGYLMSNPEASQADMLKALPHVSKGYISRIWHEFNE